MAVRWMTLLASGAMAMGGVSLAGEFAEWCVASAPEGAENPEETCACMEAETKGNEAARASMKDVGEIKDREERFAAMIPDAQDAVSACRQE